MKRLTILTLIGAASLAGAIVLDRRHGADMPIPASGASGPGMTETPSVDVVRVNAAGDAMMAGRGPALAEITVFDGEVALGKTIADERGDWVFVPSGSLAEGKHRIFLEARLPGGQVARAGKAKDIAIPKRN
ncbi:MAG: hypothetical protein ACKVSF_03325 [Alphaproteobacteria bacterium]